MLSEKTREDIVFDWNEGFCKAELYDKYEGIDHATIDEICDEEDQTWFKD